MLGERALESLRGRVELAPRREHQTAAPRRDRETPRDARTGRALFEAGEQCLRSVDVTDRQRRFDRVAVDPPDRRLAEGDAFEHLERLRQVPVGGDRLAGRELG